MSVALAGSEFAPVVDTGVFDVVSICPVVAGGSKLEVVDGVVEVLTPPVVETIVVLAVTSPVVLAGDVVVTDGWELVVLPVVETDPVVDVVAGGSEVVVPTPAVVDPLVVEEVVVEIVLEAETVVVTKGSEVVAVEVVVAIPVVEVVVVSNPVVVAKTGEVVVPMVVVVDPPVVEATAAATLGMFSIVVIV